jgi:ArsR family transcriptional regulator
LPIDSVRVAQWFHALSDTTRLAILEFLSQRERCVRELAEILGASQSSVSFHLKVLQTSGVIQSHPFGRWKYYGIRREALDFLIAFIQVVMPGKHAGTCALSCCQ